MLSMPKNGSYCQPSVKVKKDVLHVEVILLLGRIRPLNVVIVKEITVQLLGDFIPSQLAGHK